MKTILMSTIALLIPTIFVITCITHFQPNVVLIVDKKVRLESVTSEYIPASIIDYYGKWRLLYHWDREISYWNFRCGTRRYGVSKEQYFSHKLFSIVKLDSCYSPWRNY